MLARAIRRCGPRYVVVIHDAIGHLGDPTGRLVPWFNRETRIADLVVTLSRSVADDLIRRQGVDERKVLPLFHPDLRFGSSQRPRVRPADSPLRLLFLGRILAYKNLPLLVEAVELLKAEGVPIRLGVAGSGSIDGLQSRLDSLEAEVINRWIDDEEISLLTARYDAVVLPYVEASQSGVAAVAFGNCMPVVALRAGGLGEQVISGKTGLLANQMSARALADAIRELALDRACYSRISEYLSETAGERSMRAFIGRVMELSDRRIELS